MKVSFDNVHFYEVKLKVDVDKLGGRGAEQVARKPRLLPPPWIW